MPVDVDRLRSALADRYTIEREIGRGGMAIVYLAQDVQHHRRVAVKVLKPELAATLGTSRFHHEIEIAARLAHPHILPVYNSGEADGFLYYVMPFVEGESLQERLEREGQLPLEDALRIAAEVADGLSYAHDHGVIHRDIKPGNILLSSDHAVISDFGIARAVSLAGGERVTQAGLAVGSVLYMSPEQASCDERVDARTDIYALGCVLYEMLAGEPPFTGRTPQAIMARRMTDTLPPLRAMRDTIPLGAERAITRALNRTPADRFASAAQFADALREAAREADGAAGLPARSAGLLPVAILITYAATSLLVMQLTMTLTDRFGLSPWFLRGAVAVILVGLSAVVATAFVQTGPAQRGGIRRVLRSRLTWRRSIGANLLLFAAWALAAAGLILAERAEPPGAVAGPPADDAYDPARIAVLYFDDHSQAGDLEYLANGLTEAVIHELGQVEALQVISRNGVKPYRDAPASLDSIARALGAGTVVEGSVTRFGERLRVTASITETRGMTQLASLGRERTGEDWLSIIDDIVGDIASEFRERLGVEIRLRERSVATSSSEAWGLVQRAEQLRDDHVPLMMAGDVQGAENLLVRADTLLVRAQGLDPAWIEPVVHRGWVAAEMADLLVPAMGYDPEWIDRGRRFADVALGREPGNPEALELRGVLRYRAWNAAAPSDCELLAAAEEDLRRAVALDPTRARAWVTLADLFQYGKGDFAQARLAARAAYDEDAFLSDAADILSTLSTLSADLEGFEEAIAWAEEGRRRFPADVRFPATELHVMTHGGTPGVDRAWELVEAVERLASPRTRELYGSIMKGKLAAVLARAGLADSARSHLQRVLAQAPDDPDQLLAQEEAHAWLLLGDREAAVRALATYLDAHPDERAYAAHDPWWRELHGDPRFEALVEFEPEAAPACGGRPGEGELPLRA